MTILTKNDLLQVRLGASEQEVRAFSNKKNQMFEARRNRNPTVFLSHSHHDKEQIEKALVLLNKLGVDVYVDWLDEGMPDVPNGETARKIKDKIKENRKFVVLATNKAITSKWVNWELGYGDADKYIENISIIPIAENDGNWIGNEYLQIYPRVEKESSYNYYKQVWDTIYTVIYPNGKKIMLKDWLTN
ncbi:toll/interleukin-1 receptor domain-containing protein [Xanthocytophaga agilis]|uniref:Toll/interleukin-1 receptor domain-containing protein n=1 Tax=Xanthocytophaga agilis TaxID=3048010 RepID=A0AAE3UF55_9BACT|nr:toll/interleukin-1 receptor domain-containing protein [Xanthocytophaga agilis]MDJ1502051.1 toll/interleukin-1 receptor domain-containing protein [Xanthocytophaga agilis]